jgi:hypothetical protein
MFLSLDNFLSGSTMDEEEEPEDRPGPGDTVDAAKSEADATTTLEVDKDTGSTEEPRNEQADQRNKQTIPCRLIKDPKRLLEALRLKYGPGGYRIEMRHNAYTVTTGGNGNGLSKVSW